MNKDQQDIVVALDGGQTTSLGLCAHIDGTILGSALAGPSNHYQEPGGPRRLESAITEGVGGALAAAGVDIARVGCLWLGMTGSVAQAREVGERMLPAARVEASPDMVTALAGASAGGEGVVVISGTGCIAYGERDDGRTARANGWGYLMGDEGSGYDIGIQVLRAATQAYDGRAESTELTWRVPQHYGLGDLWSVHSAIYGQKLTRGDIASLTRVVRDAAANGDGVALRLLWTAGMQLADAALAVITALSSAERGMNVYTTGGVFAAGDFLLSGFRERLAQHSPASRVLPARFSPSVGALLLALKSIGVLIDAPLLERMSATLPLEAVLKGYGE